MISETFKREGMLIGENALLKLNNSKVAVVGLGGVGSWCAEALARAGIGHLTLIDSDCFSQSNINRQAGAAFSSVGRPKAEVMAERVKDINPNTDVRPVVGLFAPDMIEGMDYVADCIDTVSAKLILIEKCVGENIPVVCAMGTGNKKDASMLEITDISKTINDPLSRVMRKELRSRGINHIPVVYSKEEPMVSNQTELPPPGRRSVPGSLVWVPATAGLLMSQKIVLDLIDDAK